MKRLFMLLMVVFPMTMASHYAMAQEVTITLTPGWNWISYPNAVAMEVNDAFGDYMPMDGDVVKSEFGFAEYHNGNWVGSLTHFIPGKGYMYYSVRSEVTEFVFVKSTVSDVVTVNPTDITNTSAVSGGFITLSESSHVFLRGVCWGTEPNPYIDGNHTSDGTGTGSFSSALDNLTPNTTYYVRAYVVSDGGLSYGNEVSFTTELISGYIVTTLTNPSEGGMVTGGGSYEEDATCTLIATPNEGYIFTNWTENGEVVSADATYSFSVMNDRSLVANFISQSGAPTGVIDGLFTINAEGDQVRFSQGNLQYQASTDTWRFAENQWEHVGTANAHISSEYDGWIDLFGWGTSGYHNIYDNFNVNYQPYSNSSAAVNTACNSYGYGPSTNMSDPNLTGLSVEYDWGVHNAISNGGNQTGLWRTLSREEWEYIFFTRTASTIGNTSNARFTKAKVNGVSGVIIFPDDFSVPNYLPTPLQINNINASFDVNSYSIEGWAAMESLGCVFLPLTGYRKNTSMYSVINSGCYWSSSHKDSGYSYYLFFHDSDIKIDYYERYKGYSVRLVCDAE